MAEVVESNTGAPSKRYKQCQKAQCIQNAQKKCREDIASSPQNHRFLPNDIRRDRSPSTPSDAISATNQDQSADARRRRPSCVDALRTGRCGKDLSCQDRRKDVWLSAVRDRRFPRSLRIFTAIAAARRPRCAARFLEQTTELCDL